MIVLKSHGFKFSRPEANIVFDVSYFKNPWRDEEIRNWKGNKEGLKLAIMRYMEKQEGIKDFVENVADVLFSYNDYFPNENIQVAICCSAGEYRSPAIVELVSEALNRRGNVNIISHSENSKI